MNSSQNWFHEYTGGNRCSSWTAEWIRNEGGSIASLYFQTSKLIAGFPKPDLRFNVRQRGFRAPESRAPVAAQVIGRSRDQNSALTFPKNAMFFKRLLLSQRSEWQSALLCRLCQPGRSVKLEKCEFSLDRA
ncbi:hypothetical protein ABK249_21110 [Neorhizobium sp. Rsf11]|uniref:Uncharacterized protein n=1 Tax=Neorhizobium phenanthreniclasticum TaxID=3157917 RepID=A0ABV0M6E3_9HYPH